MRALARCGGSTVDIMEGALWLAGYNINGVPDIGNNSVTVMNLSLGSGNTQCSQWEQDVIDVINGFGVFFVVAAGNDGGPVNSPATCSGVVSVAAHGPTGNLSGYSSFGPQIEVVAPGGDFNARGSYRFEDGVASATGPNANSYTYNNGTSMASPHVTGALSVAQAVYPQLTFGELRQLFLDTGDDCGNCQGVPTLRLDRILQELQGMTPVEPSPTPAPTPTPEPTPEPTPTPEPDPDDDVFEENDDADQAAPIECGRAVQLFAKAQDQDWFVVQAAVGAQIDASISAENDADLDLYIVEGGQIVVDSTPPLGKKPSASWRSLLGNISSSIPL
ncbi:MAG: S8 family serine peptidase [Deltaproteobacteria bacterium]|nr:S8 family serine peptidase [Deltaproteobacteria bacterium]